MVTMDIKQDDNFVTLYCTKYNGEKFTLVIDKQTKEVVEKPENPDIDASVAYSHIYHMLKTGEELPERDCAAWG